jgi:8-oxo-(d)GTP phosphatase
VGPRPRGARLAEERRLSLVLIRHAMAGDPKAWLGDDRVRPVDKQGRTEAQALVAALAGQPLNRIVSSPYVRCVQTVEPLAGARGLEIELDDRLGADRLHDVPQVLAELEGQDAAVCTHGDLPWLGDRKFKKGAAWVLSDHLKPERYIPPRS